jgi:hypothetical protein
VKQGLPREVTDEESSSAALSTECPSSQTTFVVTVERDAKMLHVDKSLTGSLTHDLNGVLVSQKVTALHRVIGMVFPLVTAVG